jgi:hypothetical protein
MNRGPRNLDRSMQAGRPGLSMRRQISLRLLLYSAIFSLQIAGPAARGEEVSRPAQAVLDRAHELTWPDAQNTGVPAGVMLKSIKGDVLSEADGQVIEALDISGAVYINHNNVTLQKSKITAAALYLVKIKLGLSGVVIQDCEINGTGIGNEGSNGIAGQGMLLRNNIYNVENGITLQGEGSSLIQDNFIHSLKASGSPHYDGIEIDGSIANATIAHNTVINDYNQTSAVMVDNYFGPISNIQVINNRLIGGGYTVYSDGQFTSAAISNVAFINNRLGKGQWGYRSFVKNAPVWRGNVDDVTGRPLGGK